MVFVETITIECFLGGLTIAINGFTMVFLCCYHRFQWFLMVPDHWSNNVVVSMHRCGLICNNYMHYLNANWFQLFLYFYNFSSAVSITSCGMRCPYPLLLVDTPTNRCPGNNVSIKPLIKREPTSQNKTRYI